MTTSMPDDGDMKILQEGNSIVEVVETGLFISSEGFSGYGFQKRW